MCRFLFSWNMIEAKEEKYDFNIVNSILQFANKYDLKIELLWFSTNMVGDSFTYLTPQYVLQNYHKRFGRNDEGSFWNYYGYQYTMILDDSWVLVFSILSISLSNGNQHNAFSSRVFSRDISLSLASISLLCIP